MRVVGVFLIAATLGAQPPAKLGEPFDSIAALAHAAPPEFAANALLDLAERGGSMKKDARIGLMEEAFRVAVSAQYKMPYEPFRGNELDSNVAYLSQAYRLKMDSLSLEARAVRDLINVDNAKARELFLQIPQPALKPLTCEDALVPNVAPFYEALTMVVQNTFSPLERSKEEHLNFLLSYLAQVTSPVQLAPMARLVKSAGLTGSQQELLVGRFNAILENMQADDRSYTATLREVQGEMSPEMAGAFAKYQQRGSSGAKCNDAEPMKADLSQPAPADAKKTENVAKVDRYWQSAAAKHIYELARKLRYSSDGAVLTVAQRSTEEWKQQLEDFFKEMNGWAASDENSEADYFHQKCIVYESLIDLTPADQHGKLVGEFLSFLNSSNLQQQSPVEWFIHAKSIYERIRNGNLSEGQTVLAEYEASGNPTLALYVGLEKTFAAKAPAWATGAIVSQAAPAR